jgi:hypothetical protein
MKPQLSKTNIVLAILALTVLGALWYFSREKGQLRLAYYILGKAQNSGFETGYLIARSQAMSRKQPTFAFNGKVFNTETGRAAKTA